VERVQETILEECWKPAFPRCLIPTYTGLRPDLGWPGRRRPRPAPSRPLMRELVATWLWRPWLAAPGEGYVGLQP
jgi:hypothetical protein